MLIAGLTTEFRGVHEMKPELKVACLAGAFALATSGALANVTYVYTGRFFTNFQNSGGLFTFGDKVTGEVVLPAALGSNFPFQPVTPLSFSLSAGDITEPGFNTTSSFSFSTDSSGRVNSWNVAASSVIIHTGRGIQSSNTTSFIQDSASVGTFFSSFTASNNDLPGFWTLETGGGGSVPEPASWTMMLIGFAGLGFMAYRARRTTAATRPPLPELERQSQFSIEVGADQRNRSKPRSQSSIK
jgi:PEP-CTERM motif